MIGIDVVRQANGWVELGGRRGVDPPSTTQLDARRTPSTPVDPPSIFVDPRRSPFNEVRTIFLEGPPLFKGRGGSPPLKTLGDNKVVLRAQALLGASAAFLPDFLDKLKSELRLLFDSTTGGELKPFISAGNWIHMMTALSSWGSTWGSNWGVELS